MLSGPVGVGLILLTMALRADLIPPVYGLCAMGVLLLAASPFLIWITRGERERRAAREALLQQRALEESRPIIGSRSYDGS
jgi:hypothetical protein